LAVRHADAIALRLARPILALRRLTRPAVTVLTASSGLFLRLLRQKEAVDRPFHTLDDLKVIVNEAAVQGFVYARDVHEAALRGAPADLAKLIRPALILG
jgi:CBS domain containing-hemolysin-like protein